MSHFVSRSNIQTHLWISSKNFGIKSFKNLHFLKMYPRIFVHYSASYVGDMCRRVCAHSHLITRFIIVFSCVGFLLTSLNSFQRIFPKVRHNYFHNSIMQDAMNFKRLLLRENVRILGGIYENWKTGFSVCGIFFQLLVSNEFWPNSNMRWEQHFDSVELK